MTNLKLLLVDDDKNILKQLRWALESDYQVLTSSIEGEALSLFEREKPPVVLLDLCLEAHNSADIGGMRLLERILSAEPMTRTIVITGKEDDQSALRAVRLGTFDYYAKPIKLDELKVMIQRAFHVYNLQHRLNKRDEIMVGEVYGMVGSSKPMKGIFRFIERVSLSDVSVLICGESGTGKEFVAQAIHAHSQRKNNPFVVVNCGAIPENLLESELFGHEQGAFTDALAHKRGKFELAHTGTLFLDEIGELVPPLQVKLLRFLEDHRIERVGGTQPIELNVRIIAATKRDLKKDIENGLFREDLYYRLKVAPVEIPPLRERREDIIPLAEFFLKKFSVKHRKSPIALSPEAEGALLMYGWPGNVRELENLISRSVVLSSRTIRKPNDLGFVLDQMPMNVNLKFAKKALEMNFVKKALHRNGGIVSRAARELGISRVNLYELLEKYHIRPQDFKVIRAGGKTPIRTGGLVN
jgi:two-component system NtrC family response regulator